MPTTFLTLKDFKICRRSSISANHKARQIADRLHEAIEGGELLDNAELEAAKNEQAFVEGRIKELEICLRQRGL